MNQAFRWLHISDLHAGATGHAWLWPKFKSQFLDDLKRMHKKTGPWDVVIFSGDLAQRGTKADYEKVTEALKEIWQIHQDLGFNPPLVTVPGNHDINRPSPQDPVGLVVTNWFNYEENIRDAFFQKGNQYQNFLDNTFKEYLDWKKYVRTIGIPTSEEKLGLLPGDFSTTINTESGSLGIVGLNSTWVQLNAGDFFEKLSVDVRQLLTVTDNDPDAWRKKHNKSILITHHPAEWLHPRARGLWNSEINPTNRFDVHLYGHMHQPNATATTTGGSQPRRSVQAASLFGLERAEQGWVRINGYSIASLDMHGGLRVWPRINQKLKSDDWKIVPDVSLDLDEEGSFYLAGGNASPPLPLTVAPAQGAASAAIGAPDNLRISATQVLHSLRYYIPGNGAHLSVRKVEQHRIHKALEDARAVWLSAEWGSGSDGFLKSVLTTQERAPIIYRIDLSEYKQRDEFLDEFKAKTEISFEHLCIELAKSGRCCLILDNCPTSLGTPPPGKLSPEADIEQVAEALRTFCPDLLLILRSLRAPAHPEYTHVPLRPLDEADVRSYVLNHEKGGAQHGDTDAISAIYRHTDGVPARIDTTLRDLEIVPIDELLSTNSDLVRVEASLLDVPSSLQSAIDQLASSKDPDQKRAYALLKALAAFPAGETIVRLRRFYGSQPIFPGHARELLDSSLISNAGPIGAQVGNQGDTEKLLIVPRPVRDYVRALLSDTEQRELNRAAASIYFGEKWPTHGLKKAVAERFSRPSVSSYEVTNSTSIIIRILNESLDTHNTQHIESIIKITKEYLSSLFRGDHFRHVASLARDVLSRLPEEKAAERAFINYELGRALRMLGKSGEASEIFSKIDNSYFSAQKKRMLMLSQALTRQRLGDSVGAVDFAQKILKEDRKSSTALQAKAIILEENPETQEKELRLLELTCRRKSADVVANNLALARASRKTTSREEANEALDEIINSKKDPDFYNKVRAIVKKIKIANTVNESISDKDKSLLIDSYHFLYNERLPSLFDSCHEALWGLFTQQNDQENLLKLFLHSSLIWRLRGTEEHEASYLRKLAQHVHSLIAKDYKLVSREVAYYLVREMSTNSKEIAE